ncbi:E3 ubiquitin-protein ligase TRIM56 [Holothuria leucospilota]|uniref:E3 ubiquitin-protein ligase TRIM56 n=1 Tax=Holothuria leucospilota TaxID=206669 RepID=A0A9Q0YLJ5_HOLLE|nr:E3 ubiquitin-protein ligase TRIM56 [Holothuria leucospilota]
MAENALQSLSEDFVHCTICTEPYNDPKVLPYLHSFCLQCLERWASNRHDQPFSCPTCRCAVDVPSSGIGGLPSNFFLVSLKERLEEVSRLSKQNTDCKCYICKSKVDILFCLDCKTHICNGCKEIHDRFTKSNSHPLIPSDKMSDESYLKRVMSTQVPYCNTHEQEKVRYYCTQCSHLACQICATVNHQGHQSLHEVKDIVTSIKIKLKDLLEQSNIDLNTVLDKSKQTARQTEKIKEKLLDLRCKIDARYEELVAKLESDKQELQAHLDTIENENCVKLDDIDQNISKWLSAMEHFQKMTGTILAQENSWEILEMERSIVESIERLRSEKVRVTTLSTPTTINHDFLPSKLSVLDENVTKTNISSKRLSWTDYLRPARYPAREQELEKRIKDLNEEMRQLKFRNDSLKQLNEVNILGTFKPLM